MTADDLQKFCADANDVRYMIWQPWSDGLWTYATNGHIIIRVKRLDDVAENNNAPNAARLFAEAKPAVSWTPVPEATMPPDVECEECKGTGVFEWRESINEPVEKEDCEWCNHTGKVKQHIGVRVDGISFDQGYLSMLQGWDISPTGAETPAWVRNADLEAVGLLMPRNE